MISLILLVSAVTIIYFNKIVAQLLYENKLLHIQTLFSKNEQEIKFILIFCRAWSVIAGILLLICAGLITYGPNSLHL
jgi:hypothetical protein